MWSTECVEIKSIQELSEMKEMLGAEEENGEARPLPPHPDLSRQCFLVLFHIETTRLHHLRLWSFRVTQLSDSVDALVEGEDNEAETERLEQAMEVEMMAMKKQLAGLNVRIL